MKWKRNYNSLWSDNNILLSEINLVKKYVENNLFLPPLSPSKGGQALCKTR